MVVVSVSLGFVIRAVDRHVELVKAILRNDGVIRLQVNFEIRLQSSASYKHSQSQHGNTHDFSPWKWVSDLATHNIFSFRARDLHLSLLFGHPLVENVRRDLDVEVRFESVFAVVRYEDVQDQLVCRFEQIFLHI